MGFRLTEKCPEERNFIIILNHQLGYKLYDLILCNIPVIFIESIDNHCLILHTHILHCKFQEQFDNKLTKLNIKPFSKQSRIMLNSWVQCLSILINLHSELMSNSYEKPQEIIYIYEFLHIQALNSQIFDFQKHITQSSFCISQQYIVIGVELNKEVNLSDYWHVYFYIVQLH